MSTYESLISVLGLSEETARDFTVQTASDIAARSVELCQILERLASDGDAICNALESRTVAQGDISGGQRSVRLLKTILPHIKAYCAGRVDEGVVQDGEVSSTESSRATSNENETSSPSQPLNNSQESLGGNLPSLQPDHVPSTVGQPTGAIYTSVTSCASEMSCPQSHQPALGSERGATSHSETAASSSVQVSQSLPFSNSLLSATSLADSSEAASSVTISKANSPAVQVIPDVSLAVAPLQASESTSHTTVLALTTLAATTHAPTNIVVHTCLPQPIAAPYPYASRLALPPPHSAVCMASVHPSNAARTLAVSIPQSQPPFPWLSNADHPWYPPSAQIGAAETVRQALTARMQWPSAQHTPRPIYPKPPAQHQYYPPGGNAASRFLQSTVTRFQDPYGGNVFNLIAPPPPGGLFLGRIPHTMAIQAVPPPSNSQRAPTVLPVMPSIMTPAIYPPRRAERMLLGTSSSSSLPVGQQSATQNAIYPPQGHPLPRQQHLTPQMQHQQHQLIQPRGHTALSAVYTSQPPAQPQTRPIQRSTGEVTPIPQNLTICNHPHINVRQIPAGITLQQPSSISHTSTVAAAPLNTRMAAMSQSVSQSQSMLQSIADSDQVQEAESVLLCVDPTVELPTAASDSAEQVEERCCGDHDDGHTQTPHPQTEQAGAMIPVEELSKRQPARIPALESSGSLAATTDGPSKANDGDAAGEPEITKVHIVTGPSSPKDHPGNAASRRGDSTGVATQHLQLQGPVASVSEVQVLASGSVQSLPCAHPVEVPQAVPSGTPTCREPAVDSSIGPTTDVTVRLIMDRIVAPALEATSCPKVHSAVQTPPQAKRLSVEPTAPCPNAATSCPPMDPVIHLTVQPTGRSTTETAIQLSTDATVHPPMNATTRPPKEQISHPRVDPSVNLSTVPTVHPPMGQGALPLSINAKSNGSTISNGRLSFVALIKQHALLHLAALVSLSEGESARLAIEKEATTFSDPPPDFIELKEGAESMEINTVGTSPTSQSSTAFEATTSEDSRLQENPPLSPSQHEAPAHPESSRSAEGRGADDVGSSQAKRKQAKLKRRRMPPLSGTPKRKLPRLDRVPPLTVGTAVLVKFGVGENANWREGVITDSGCNGRKHGAPAFVVTSEGRPCSRRKELYQLAVAEPAKGEDLRIKDVVVGWYGDLGIRFSGVVAETPVKENGYRVLVFFFDGFAQYLSPSRLHLCYQWNKITLDREYRGMRTFFKEYFLQYPQRLMLRLKEGDTVQLERFQDVLPAQVVQVDCSMVKLQFSARESSSEEDKYEWLYRGSTRLMSLCKEVSRRKTKGSAVANPLFTFTDELFDPECPPSITPPDNTGIFPCSGQTPGKKRLPAGKVAKKVAASVPRRRSSELQHHPFSPASPSTLVDPDIGDLPTPDLPTPPSALPMAKETLPLGRKRVASVDSHSKAKRARSLSTDTEGTTLGIASSNMEGHDSDDDDDVFQVRSHARRIKKSKPPVRSSSVDLPPCHLQPPVSTASASAPHPKQESEEDDAFSSREYVARYFSPPEFDHRCGPPCKGDASLPDNYLLYHSLAFPLMLKWRRCKQMYRKGNRQTSSCHLYYVAPCGIRLKSLQEVEDQLCAMEEDRITVDMFSFDVAISLNFKPIERPAAALFYNEDLSGGLEMVPLPCVNELDTEAPPTFEYAAHRRCGPGVEFGPSSDFLVSCSCGSGHCAKEGCLCNKLSMEEAQRTRLHDLMHPLHVAEVGYTHRRLLTERAAAIFECNDGCQCSKSCGNRVVQSEVRARLQVFKTADRGWGVRCLDDLPKGTFLAHYSGIILTDKDADEAAHLHTDAYLVDLDYIEVMESQKGSIEYDPLTGTSNTSSASTTTIPAFSFDSQTTADNLDCTWEGSFLAEEMEEGVGVTQQNDETSTRRGTRAASSDKPKESSPTDNLAPKQAELPSSSSSPHCIAANPPRLATVTCSPSSDDEGDLPFFDLSNMTSRHPTLNSTPSLRNEHRSSPLATVKAKFTPTVKQEDCTIPLAMGFGEEVHGKRRHVGTGARRATGSSREDPICLSESESDDDSSESVTDTSTPSSGSSPPSGGSPSSTELEQLPLPDSSPCNDTRVSLQRQCFGEQQVYVIDASRVGNVARFFNHSCQPNLFVQNVFVDNHDIRLPWVALFARTNIKAMTELTWDYNYVPGSVPNRELECKCGAPECRGRLL